MKRSVEQFAEQQRLRNNSDLSSVKNENKRIPSVYDNYTPGKNENSSEFQTTLFSNSLENVMSDFDDALSYGNRNNGPPTDKDYCSDWEVKKQSKRAANFPTPALKASAGRNEGYTSDCGYAVPKLGQKSPSAKVSYSKLLFFRRIFLKI